MNKEEAIEILKAHHMWTGEPQEIIDVRKENKALEMAIQALSQEPCDDATLKDIFCMGCEYREQEPCDDAVSREAVLQAVSEGCQEWRGIYGRCEELINALPPITQKSGWIPVSERLPEDGTYLVTVERIDGKPRTDINSFAKDLNKVDEFDFPKHKCGWYNYDSEYGYWEDTKVIAWMPLPEPYEPREKRCADCNHYGKLSLDCGRCDDDCSMYEPQESEVAE